MSASNAYYARLGADAKLALAQGKITAGKELADRVAVENEKYAAVKAALEREAALYKEQPVQMQQVLDREKAAEQQHLAAIDALEEQQAQKENERNQQLARSFQQIFAEPVKRAFDAEVQGILQGTETIGQVTAKVFSDMAVSFIEAVMKMIAQWLAFEAVTASFGGGAASMLGMSAGPLGMLGGLLGGGGGAAGVASDIMMIAPMATGAIDIPATGMSLVHQGEMMIPADFASGLRSGQLTLGAGGGGGLAVNLAPQVNAMDARSVIQGVVNNQTVMRSLATALARYLPMNPSTQF